MVNIQITVPDDTLKTIERRRKATGETQSEFLMRALHTFLNQQKEAEAAAQYIRGYEQYPEDSEDMAWIEAAQREVLLAYPWEDDDAE